MSGGKQESKSTSNAQQTSTQALDPQIKNALLSNYASFNTNVPGYTPYAGTTVADFTPAQQSAFGLVGDIANNQTGSAPLNSAINTTAGLTGFTPTQVTAPTASAGLIDPNSVSTIDPKQIANTNLTPYLNPYNADVIATTTAAANQNLGIQEAQNESDATKAGAWRGNGVNVQNAVDQAMSNTGLAQTIAQLESAGFTTALGAAGTDVAAQNTAQAQNQATQLAEGTVNAGNTQATNLANQQAGLTAGLANQAAGITGAGIRQTAATGLAGMGEQELNDSLTRANAELQAGNQQQQQAASQLQWAYQNGYLNPQQYAMALQQLRNQTLGLAGNPTLTQSQGTSASSGQSSGTTFSLMPVKSS